MLSSISVRGFKSLGDVSLQVADLTLLVGWNASGKSNVLEALELLCWTARAPRLSELSQAIDQHQVRVRGNLRDLAPFGADAALPVPPGAEGDVLRFACTIAPPVTGDAVLTTPRLQGVPLGTLHLELDLRLSTRGLVLERERLRAPSLEALGYRLPLYEVASGDAHDGAVQVRYQTFRRGRNPRFEAIADQPCFVQLTTPARFQASHSESREVIPLAARRVRDVLGDVRILDPAPHTMRGYAFSDDDQLHLTGDNLSAVLRKLVAEGEGAAILAFVADLPEAPVDDLAFLSTPRNEVMVVLQETFGGRVQRVPAALMSDGTLRVLAIAAALLSAPQGALVVIEEIDNGVHPSRAASLLTTILRTARRRQVRVLITTHNPALQDALPDDALADVTLAYRHADTGRTELRRLGDLEAFPRIAAGGPLGRMVTERSFERLVKHGPARDVDLGWLRAGLTPGEE